MFVRPIRLSALVGGTAAIIALTAGCNDTTSDTAPSTSGVAAPLPSSAAPSSAASAVDGIGTDAAEKLCSQLRGSVSDWRVQGPTLGKPALNLMVQTWAAQNGMVNVQVLRDRSIIDTITTESCPEVRQEAMKALNIPDLASGLVGG